MGDISGYTTKFKFHPIKGYEGPEWETMYRATLSLTAGLNGVGGQRHAAEAGLL
jgi:hypothetical protein